MTSRSAAPGRAPGPGVHSTVAVSPGRRSKKLSENAPSPSGVDSQTARANRRAVTRTVAPIRCGATATASSGAGSASSRVLRK